MLLLSLMCIAVAVAASEAAGAVNNQAVNMYKNTFNGDATYYGGAGGGGACGFGSPNPPVAGQTRMTVALNRPQFMNSIMCGSCWRVSGSGHGSGGSPVTGTFVVFVDNLCPECQTGSVDLGVSGDGRWDVTIQAVQCPVSGNIEFKFQGSNPYYIKLQARNVRLPVHQMEIQFHGNWEQMTHTADGYFTHSGGPIEGDIHVRLTAINGAQVTETISGGIRNDVIIQGRHQFPLDGSLPHA